MTRTSFLVHSAPILSLTALGLLARRRGAKSQCPRSGGPAKCEELSNGLTIRRATASSGAMTARMFSYIIPRSPVTVIAPCRKETRSSSKLFRDRRALRRPTSQRRADEAVGNYLADRERLPAGHFYSTSIRAKPHCVNGAHSISRALLDKLWDDWVLRRQCRHLPPTPLARRDRPRCRVLSRKAYQW